MGEEEVCSVPGCGREVKAKGWCKGHYGRWYRWGDPLRGDPRRANKATPKPRPAGTGRRGRPRADWRTWLDLDHLAATTLDPGWEDEGRCVGGPADWFFPEHGVTGQARAVCEACPVRLPCLLAGLGEDHGVWGGSSVRERRTIRRALAAHLRQQAEGAA